MFGVLLFLTIIVLAVSASTTDYGRACLKAAGYILIGVAVFAVVGSVPYLIVVNFPTDLGFFCAMAYIVIGVTAFFLWWFRGDIKYRLHSTPIQRELQKIANDDYEI